MLAHALVWASSVLSCRADCAAKGEECLATALDSAASWVQRKVGKMDAPKAKPAQDIDQNGYFYTKRGGDATGSNAITWSIPQDFLKPAWTWSNELDEQIRHSALIDDKKNIYIAGTTRLRKFSPDGKMLWLFEQDEAGNTSPTMGKGVIYFRVGYGKGHNRVYALSMETGEVLFKKTVAGFGYGPDSQSLLLAGGRLFLPALSGAPRSDTGGCDSLIALNASTGDELWSYTTDEVMWNFSPSTPDDGKSITFSSTCGAFTRISAIDGKLMVKSTADVSAGPCSTGGGSTGTLPWGAFSFDTQNYISAYNITTGEIAWTHRVEPPYRSCQYPAVGYLYEGGPLAVVAAVGQIAGKPKLMADDELQRYLSDADYRRHLNTPVYSNAVIALDAATGSKIWQWNEADWDHFAAAGDEEGFARRRLLGSIENDICLPDNQGIPVVNTKDGTVIVSSSHNGNMTVIRDANKNGIIEDNETTAFATGVAFLNGPATAPGMLVASPCWGPMYVFRQ
ncbi:SHOC2 [Symbiodinium natans]|uniref:SHOC2 protein n=1 Tax=Symbiodinium natans TaxID=878477 RepID=A0A812LJZ8_9DINO|nr:SHOC2 [Symbiodinium natans]